MKRIVAVSVMLAGCATSGPRLTLEQGMRLEMNPIVCLIQAHSPVAEHKALANVELSKRGHTCTAGDVREGYQHIKAKLTEREQREAQASAERWRTAGSILKGAAFIGGALLLSLPPPQPIPRPIQCSTTPNGLVTTCQ